MFQSKSNSTKGWRMLQMRPDSTEAHYVELVTLRSRAFQLLRDIFEIKNWRRSSSRREPLSLGLPCRGPPKSDGPANEDGWSLPNRSRDDNWSYQLRALDLTFDASVLGFQADSQVQKLVMGTDSITEMPSSFSRRTALRFAGIKLARRTSSAQMEHSKKYSSNAAVSAESSSSIK